MNLRPIMKILKTRHLLQRFRTVGAWLAASLVLVFNPVFTVLADEVRCGSLTGGIGPWDYNDPGNRVPTGDAPQTRIKLVENVHFKQNAESLNYKDKNLLVGDITYTLNIFPNHPRALLALSKLEQREGGKLPYHENNVGRTVDCYFDRAIRFRPDDGMVRMIHAMHFQSRKRYGEALEAYKLAEDLGMNTAVFHYNLGLLLFDLKNYEGAYERARKAYDGGFPLPGLKNKLQGVGRWP